MDWRPCRPKISTDNTSVSNALRRGFLYMILSGFATVALGVFSPTQAQVGARPSAVSIHLDRCVAYYNRGNLPRAILELRKAQRLVPNDLDINFMLGNALYRSGDMREAATEYEKVLTLRPNHFEARMSRGFALFEVEEFQEALAEWLAAMRLDPNEPFARAGLAVGLYKIGRVDDARVQYAMALALDRRYGDAESLRLDIRWKPKTLSVVTRLLELLQSNRRI